MTTPAELRLPDMLYRLAEFEPRVLSMSRLGLLRVWHGNGVSAWPTDDLISATEAEQDALTMALLRRAAEQGLAPTLAFSGEWSCHMGNRGYPGGLFGNGRDERAPILHAVAGALLSFHEARLAWGAGQR